MCSTCDCEVKLVANEPDQVKRCRKCNSDPFILLDRVHVECRACFLESCNRKIRSTIGKSKLLKNNDPVLIAHSGGPSSTALLDLIKKSMEFETRREQKFRPSILHIDAQSVLIRDFDELRVKRKQRLDDLLTRTERLCPGWPLYWTTIEMLSQRTNQGLSYWSRSRVKNQPSSSDSEDLIMFNLEAYNAFHRDLDKFNNLTDKQQFVQASISELIVQIVKEINLSHAADKDRIKFVMVGSSSSQLANNLLVSVILGQGSSIRSTVSICDERTEIGIMRPMRDFSKKEILFYLRARNIEDVYRVEANLITYADRKSAIQTITEAFLSKLQLDYPSTCSTLLRTGNKMQD